MATADISCHRDGSDLCHRAWRRHVTSHHNAKYPPQTYPVASFPLLSPCPSPSPSLSSCLSFSPSTPSPFKSSLSFFMTTRNNDSEVEDGLRQPADAVPTVGVGEQGDGAVHGGHSPPRRVRPARQVLRLLPVCLGQTPLQSVPEQQITAYLSKIQRSGCIQPFGATLVVDKHSFCLLAFSEKVSDLLDLSNPVPSLDPSSPHRRLPLGSNVCSLFTPSSTLLLECATSAREITLLNPLWIHSHASSKPFYAICNNEEHPLSPSL